MIIALKMIQLYNLYKFSFKLLTLKFVCDRICCKARTA